jgi:large subunit ribosomal protein L24
MKLKKGDKVKIVAGKDKGREGTVERVFEKEGKVLIPGVNVYKKHSKRLRQIIEVARPLPVSNVALICPKCGKITRVGYQVLKDGKTRICRKCREVI